MMSYGGNGWAGWISTVLSLIVFWTVVVGVIGWAIRSFYRRGEVKPQKSAALGILEERYARGDITPEEFTRASNSFSRSHDELDSDSRSSDGLRTPPPVKAGRPRRAWRF